jgi:chromosomal replication initiator protein
MCIDLAREVITELVNRTTQAVSVERIQEIVARELAVTTDMIRAKTRKREVVHARQVAMFLATEFTQLTLKAIGLQFGGRDHATVIHARETVNESIKSDPNEAKLLEALRRKLEMASL